MYRKSKWKSSSESRLPCTRVREHLSCLDFHRSFMVVGFFASKYSWFHRYPPAVKVRYYAAFIRSCASCVACVLKQTRYDWPFPFLSCPRSLDLVTSTLTMWVSFTVLYLASGTHWGIWSRSTINVWQLVSLFNSHQSIALRDSSLCFTMSMQIQLQRLITKKLFVKCLVQCSHTGIK
jgi:hypothetical protein